MASTRVTAQAETRGTGVTISGEASASTVSNVFRVLGVMQLYANAALGNFPDEPTGLRDGYLIYRIAPSHGETVGEAILLRADFIADRTTEAEVAEAHYGCGILLNGLPWASYGHEGAEPAHADEWDCSLAHIGDEIWVQTVLDSSSFRLGSTFPYTERLSASFTLDLDVFYFEPIDRRDFPRAFDPLLFDPIKVETGHYALMERSSGRVTVVPIPASAWLLGLGFLLMRRRRWG